MLEAEFILASRNATGLFADVEVPNKSNSSLGREIPAFLSENSICCGLFGFGKVGNWFAARPIFPEIILINEFFCLTFGFDFVKLTLAESLTDKRRLCLERKTWVATGSFVVGGYCQN